MSALSLAVAFAAPTWTLVAGGDLMLNAISPSDKLYAGIAPLVSGADLAIANLEVPTTTSRTATRFKSAAEVRARSQYILKADPRHVSPLAKAGFDFMSLGNNHTMDYGIEGLRQMTGLLDKYGMAWTGAGETKEIAERVVVRELKDGFRVGLISYLSFLTQPAMNKCDAAGPNDPGVATLTVGGSNNRAAHLKIRGIVRKARGECDFLIVMLHWGAERQPLPREYQVSLGRLFVEEGADAVIGHHPHVLQPGELYRNKPIVYSLGNLLGPLGGSSALYRFKFEGRTFRGAEAIPYTYSARGFRLTRPDLAGFESREASLRRKFPDKRSTSLL